MGLVTAALYTERATLRDKIRHNYEERSYKELWATCKQTQDLQPFWLAQGFIDLLLGGIAVSNVLLPTNVDLERFGWGACSLASLALVISRQAMVPAQAERIASTLKTKEIGCKWNGMGFNSSS